MVKLSDAEKTSNILEAYAGASSSYEALIDEIMFILSSLEEMAGIKLHAIEHRLKSPDSLGRKAVGKGASSLDEINDVAGVRIICLFQDDLEKIDRFLSGMFEIVEIDEKITEMNSPFSYISNHYVCRLPAKYSGPRYDRIAGLKVEIQVRTLCMHCWAAVSHYLDYKGETPLPPEPKMELLALAGLFYVADRQFERFYQSQKKTEREEDKNLPRREALRAVTMDTLSQFLKDKFPNRAVSAEKQVSGLLREIKRAGYRSIADVGRDVEKGEAAMMRYEADKRKQGALRGPFATVGAARVALRIVNESVREQSATANSYKPYLAYI